jgi:hypothetical protein
MTDQALDMLYSVDRTGEPVVVIERRHELGQEALLAQFPMLLDAAHATELARVVNHFARQFQYDVIADPAAFAADYRARIAAEDPNAPWDEAQPKLRDFGMPDLDAIAAPKVIGDRLVFYAANRRLGVPYRVEVPVPGGVIGTAVYEPVPMGPLP